jgi:hypothetical protein
MRHEDELTFALKKGSKEDLRARLERDAKFYFKSNTDGNTLST